ncbi:MAG: DMT family transporter, partial [Chitinophagaceae bacterium]
MKAYYRGIISLVFVMIVWGSSFTVTKVVVETLSPIYFAFLRFLVASLVMLVVFLTKRRPPVVWKLLPHRYLIGMALSGASLFYIFFNYSLKYTAASTGALLEGFMPAIIAILSAIFLKEKLGRWQVIGIIVSFTGILMLGLVKNTSANAPDPLLGNILMIGAVFSWAVYTVLSKKVAYIEPVTTTFYVTVLGTLFLLPLVFFEMRGQAWPMPTKDAWMAIIYLGAVASALCYIMYNTALEKLTASQVGNFLNLDPVTGAIIAIIFLHEKVVVSQLAGCLLVFTGVWLSTKNPPGR